MKRKNGKFYLSIGEFSDLTGVAKERLRFYDAESIISPAYIEDNGYRYYLLEQIFPMFLIVILVRSNLYTLSKIRELINNPDISFSNLLSDWQFYFAKNSNKKTNEYDYIKSQIRHADYFANFENDTPYIINYYYSSIFVTPVNPPNYPFEETTLEFFSKHTADCITSDRTSITSLAMIFERDTFTKGDYKICGYYSHMYYFPKPEECGKSNRVKTLYYQFTSNISELKNRLDYLNQYMIDNDLICVEKIYTTVFADNFKNKTDSKCNIQIFIPVAEDKSYPARTFCKDTRNVFDTSKTVEYTSGEFAELCHISKETLRFYNRKGLIIPNVKNENGYKYYSNEQLGYYYFIKMLQKSGSTIKEIHELFLDKTMTKYSILKSCEEKMAFDIRRYSHYKNMTRALLEIREKSIKGIPYDTISTIEFYQMPHKTIYGDKKFEMYSTECIDVYKVLIQKYFKAPQTVYIPISVIVEKEEFDNSSFLLSSCSILNFEAYNSLEELPKHKFLFLKKNLSYYEIIDQLHILRKYVKDNNIETVGYTRIVITAENITNFFNNIFSVYYYVLIK